LKHIKLLFDFVPINHSKLVQQGEPHLKTRQCGGFFGYQENTRRLTSFGFFDSIRALLRPLYAGSFLKA